MVEMLSSVLAAIHARPGGTLAQYPMCGVAVAGAVPGYLFRSRKIG